MELFYFYFLFSYFHMNNATHCVIFFQCSSVQKHIRITKQKNKIYNDKNYNDILYREVFHSFFYTLFADRGY